MVFSHLYKNTSRAAISFEVFPPKNPEGLLQLHNTLDAIVTLKPAMLTVTYGAMGSTQNLTQDLVIEFRKKFQLPVASHLTCVGASRNSIRTYVQRLIDNDVRDVVALRGDIPSDQAGSVFGDFTHAKDLVAFIRSEFPMLDMVVAGYPEKHVQATDLATDIQFLKSKVDAGASAVVTQLFYNNDDFYRFRERCIQAGITVPIVPGIMPITSFKQVLRITSMCGAVLPASLLKSLEQKQADTYAMQQLGINWAIAQSKDLLKQGVPGIHYYVLNRAEAAQRIMEAIST